MVRVGPCLNLHRLVIVKRAKKTGDTCLPCLYTAPLTRDTALKAIRDSPLPLFLSPCRNRPGRYHPIYLPSKEEAT